MADQHPTPGPTESGTRFLLPRNLFTDADAHARVLVALCIGLEPLWTASLTAAGVPVPELIEKVGYSRWRKLYQLLAVGGVAVLADSANMGPRVSASQVLSAYQEREPELYPYLENYFSFTAQLTEGGQGASEAAGLWLVAQLVEGQPPSEYEPWLADFVVPFTYTFSEWFAPAR